ncbi:MAG: transporter substrate-binding domain-containing protein [Anaerolineae bacterium]
MKKMISSFLIPFFFIAKISAEGIDNQQIPPLIAGTTSGYAPYVSLDSRGQYEGFDIDLSELLAKKLNRKLVIKDYGSMPSLMLALKQRKVDLLIWAISITEERMKSMEMIYYQGEKVTEMPILFWKRIPDNIQSIEDLKDDAKKVVCVEAGTYQENIFRKMPSISLKYVDKITDAIMEIKYGKSFATVVDPSLLPYLKAQYPEIKVLNLPLSPSDYSLGNGICVNQADQQLAAEIKKAIEELTAEGKIAELEKKWNITN